MDKRRNIQVRVICNRDDRDVVAKAIQQGLEAANFQALEPPSFYPSRKHANDVLIYQDYGNLNTEVTK